MWDAEPKQAWANDAVRLKLEEGLSWTQLPGALRKIYPREQFTFDRVRSAVRGSTRYKNRNAGRVAYQDKREPTDADIQNYFDALKNVNDASMKLDRKQTKATVIINESKPFGIAFWGDWHIGGKGVDHRRLDNDADTISDTDGLYVIGMGDYKDNASALVHPQSTQESIATTDMQSLIAQHVWAKEADKTVAIIRGCHEDWDKRNSNVDFVQSLCDETGAVNLWHGGVVTVKCGEQEYRIAARHKYKFESSLNTTNAQRNMMNDFGPVDVIALAHKHYPDFQQLHRMGKDVIYIRSGSYKYYDEFGQKLAGYKGEYGVPIIIFYPDQHRMIPFSDFDAGIEVLAKMRSEV
ncbi:MAG: hypothetical protein PHY64_00690 [Eubacteriales bacterium]|nr:hypothetical protein [Eubacteriales bacterium]